MFKDFVSALKHTVKFVLANHFAWPNPDKMACYFKLYTHPKTRTHTQTETRHVQKFHFYSNGK